MERKDPMETLQQFSDAWNDHDIEKLMSFMSDDCEFHATAGPEVLGKTWKGREEVREIFKERKVNLDYL